MLDVARVDVCYGDLQVLWDVSISIKEGEIVALLGSNCAGKSTLLKTISGLLRPKKGVITYNSLRIDHMPAHHIVGLGISMVLEDRRLFSDMTVLENLEIGAYLKHARQAKSDSLEWIYEIFPILKERAGQVSGTLSGGQQQMVAIGRALMARPKMLILDEISLGLSPILVKNIFRVIKEINISQRIAILLVEQNTHMALALADRGYVMENGSITHYGDVQTLLSTDSIKNAYLGME
jgi:branched-chain amino acid transport system ATP-binding protein